MTTRTATSTITTPRGGATSAPMRAQPLLLLFIFNNPIPRLGGGRKNLTCLRQLLIDHPPGAPPPFSWGVTSGGPPGGRSLSKDGARADSANDFCRLVVWCNTQEMIRVRTKGRRCYLFNPQARSVPAPSAARSMMARSTRLIARFAGM